MSEYLTKEEIRQWRSSLERITLEEYAARLGKKLEEEKETEDIGDIVMKHGSSDDFMSSYNPPVLEKIITIGSKAFSKERELSSSKKNSAVAKSNVNKPVNKKEKTAKVKVKADSSSDIDNLNITYKKEDKTLLMEITEEIDHHFAENIRREADNEITRFMPRKAIFDFSNVSFMDSAGIGMIIGRYKMMKLIGGSLEIKNANENAKKILELSGITKIVELSK